MNRAGKATTILFLVFGFSLLGDCALADVSVPVQLQAQLVAKVSAFDRNFATRADGLARVLVLEKVGDGDSADVAAHFAGALATLRTVGGISAQIDVSPFTTAPALAERCRTQHISLVYLSTHLEAELDAMANALAGVDVLTVGSSGTYAARGVVVGFDLEEGKPRIVVNLARAKAQNVVFRGELLKLARLVATSSSP